jgi:hypothetical protein
MNVSVNVYFDNCLLELYLIGTQATWNFMWSNKKFTCDNGIRSYFYNVLLLLSMF